MMQRMKYSALLASLLTGLYGCASSPNPGSVVVAPQVTQPPLPALVLEVEPKPAGYYQNQILNALEQP